MNNQVATIYYRFVQSEYEYRSKYPWSMRDIRVHKIGKELSACGGYTLVVVRNEETGKYHLGISRCSPKDRFQRKTGREQALHYANLAMQEGVKVKYPPPTNKRDVDVLTTILDEIPPRFIYDDERLVERRN